MERDYETKGAVLIKTLFGIVSATAENFSLPMEDMASNQDWRNVVGAEGGVFCLVPDELNPF